jgi:hypothetical protein
MFVVLASQVVEEAARICRVCVNMWALGGADAVDVARSRMKFTEFAEFLPFSVPSDINFLPHCREQVSNVVAGGNS